tara:strand:+ start:101 stop:394 length:294 start_codon:yes stop_codon:yes gene_type:complete
MSDDNKLTTAAAVGFTELKGQLSRIEDMMMVIKEKNEEMAEDISKIKEAIYNPDMGIYSRLKELENWKEGLAKVLWIGATGIIGSMALHAWKLIQSL